MRKQSRILRLKRCGARVGIVKIARRRDQRVVAPDVELRRRSHARVEARTVARIGQNRRAAVGDRARRRQQIIVTVRAGAYRAETYTIDKRGDRAALKQRGSGIAIRNARNRFRRRGILPEEVRIEARGAAPHRIVEAERQPALQLRGRQSGAAIACGDAAGLRVPIAVGDGAVIQSRQSANRTARHDTGGIRVRYRAAIVVSDETAGAITTDGACRKAAVDGAGILTHQSTGVAAVGGDGAGRVAVLDDARAIVPANQSADIDIAGDGACCRYIRDCAKIPSGHAAHENARAADRFIDEAKIADGAGRNAEHAHIIGAVDRQIRNRVVQAVEDATEWRGVGS